MSVSDRIGFPPFLGWVTDHQSFFVTLLICWAITPGMMIVVGLLGEFRLIPLTPDRQFLSFFPGDLFLGVGVAAAIEAARELPESRGWWSAPIVHFIVFGAAAYVAIRMTRGELKNGAYPKWAILSPTKLYHNGALYGIYGYLAAMTVIADVVGLGWREIYHGGWLTLSVIFFVIWAVIVAVEGMIYGKAGMAKKARHAHIETWFYKWLVAYYAVKQLVGR